MSDLYPPTSPDYAELDSLDEALRESKARCPCRHIGDCDGSCTHPEPAWAVGDLVTRTGSDVHRVEAVDIQWGTTTARCIKADAGGIYTVGQTETLISDRWQSTNQ